MLFQEMTYSRGVSDFDTLREGIVKGLLYLKEVILFFFYSKLYKVGVA